jgi:hypothetical protein
MGRYSRLPAAVCADDWVRRRGGEQRDGRGVEWEREDGRAVRKGAGRQA